MNCKSLNFTWVLGKGLEFETCQALDPLMSRSFDLPVTLQYNYPYQHKDQRHYTTQIRKTQTSQGKLLKIKYFFNLYINSSSSTESIKVNTHLESRSLKICVTHAQIPREITSNLT